MIKFSIQFYVVFFITSMLGYFIFKFNEIDIETIVLYFAYLFFFVIGMAFGGSLRPRKLCLYSINSGRILKWLFPMAAVAIAFGWCYMILYYGSLSYILGNSYTIRTETIGDGIQIIPTIVSYTSSFANAGFVLSIARFYHFRKKGDLYFSFAFAFLIVLVDLQTFGRVGILYIIFVLVGCIRLFKIKIKYCKLLLYGMFLFVMLMFPRWIRGGNSIEGVADTYTPYLQFNLPSYLDPFVSLYSYYFSGIYAFNELLHSETDIWMGARNFSSLINLFQRIFVSEDSFQRITIIAKPVYIPYSMNIYTILGEAYMDFGILGLVVLPIFFGVCIGYLYKYKGVFADALKLVLVGWLLFNPIYNLFSFGGFMLAFIFLAILTLTSKQELVIKL